MSGTFLPLLFVLLLIAAFMRGNFALTLIYLVVGALAKLVMPGKDPGGIIVTMLLGIVGAVLGGYAGRALGMYGPGDSAGIFMSIFGAIAVLLVYRLAVGRRRTI